MQGKLEAVQKELNDAMDRGWVTVDSLAAVDGELRLEIECLLEKLRCIGLNRLRSDGWPWAIEILSIFIKLL